MRLTVAGPSRTRTGFRRLAAVRSLAVGPRSLTAVSDRPADHVLERPPADRCPGLLRPFLADDGALVRLRLPGGRVATSVLHEVASLAGRFGAPVVQLTSRGSLQLRALPTPLPAEFVEAVEATGLLPSASHERVRNVLAAPLARHLDPLVAHLDEALGAQPALARLSGRFLFAFSDASGSVLGERFDVAYQQLTPRSGRLYAGGLGRDVAPRDAVPAMLDIALRFVEAAPAGAWNVQDLPQGSPVLDGLRQVAAGGFVPDSATPLRPGVVGPDAVVGVPFGMLTVQHAQALADAAETVVVTPWRSVVVRDGADRVADLVAAGLVAGPDGPWARLSACVGAPSCRRTTVATLDLARSAAEAVSSSRLPVDRDVHVVGCERLCGTRASATVVVAPLSTDEVVSALTTSAEPSRGEQ